MLRPPPLPHQHRLNHKQCNAISSHRTKNKRTLHFYLFIWITAFSLALAWWKGECFFFFFASHDGTYTFYFFAAVIHILFFNCFVIIFVQHLCAQIESTWATTTAACVCVQGLKIKMDLFVQNLHLKRNTRDFFLFFAYKTIQTSWQIYWQNTNFTNCLFCYMAMFA